MNFELHNWGRDIYLRPAVVVEPTSVEQIQEILRDREHYPFQFCRDYYRRHGWRCDMLNAADYIARDQGSFFSYSFDGTVLTLDPVASGGHGRDEFLRAYNDYCAEHDGVPLFIQTKWIEPRHVRRAFGERIAKSRAALEKYDRRQRMLNAYSRELFYERSRTICN